MNRAEEKQFIAEHAYPWRLIKGTWVILIIVSIVAMAYAWAPPSNVSAKVSTQIDHQWPQSLSRLQHSDDDHDEFFDPSDP